METTAVTQSISTPYVPQSEAQDVNGLKEPSTNRISLGTTIVPILRNFTRRLDVVLRKVPLHITFAATDIHAADVSGEEGRAGIAGMEASVGSLNDCHMDGLYPACIEWSLE